MKARQPPDFGIGALFELVGDAVVVGDVGTGTVLLWNAAAERLFGYSRAQAVGMPLEQLVTEDHRAAHRAGIARYLETGTGDVIGAERTVDLPALRADGSTVWVELRLTGLAGPPPGPYAMAILRDVSERHEAAASLAATLDELHEANLALRDFLSMAAHDLNAPLSAVSGALQMLASDRNLGGDQRSLVDIALRQTKHVAQLVDDLLVLARIDGHALQPHLQKVRVAAAISDAVVGVDIGEGDLRTEVDPDTQVLADPAHVRRILTNYLTNAVRYGRPPFTVFATQDGDHAAIVVADEGDGVAEEIVPRLFTRFTKGRAAHASGTGLGLSIVQGLARANDGEAWYEPRDGGGARFGVRLPLVP